VSAGDRRVRITLDATVRTHALTPHTVRAVLTDGTVVLLPAGAVDVEDVTPARVWTDGDVVQWTDTDAVRVRRTGDDGVTRWLGGLSLFTQTDARVDAALARGAVRVLRYQHGKA
jgi:hypothetical protein